MWILCAFKIATFIIIVRGGIIKGVNVRESIFLVAKVYNASYDFAE